MKIVTVH